MTRLIFTWTVCLVFFLMPVFGQQTPEGTWEPSVTEKDQIHGFERTFYRPDADPGWGYAVNQQDTFAVIAPSKGDGPHPLCVMLHSAGGGIDESFGSRFKTDGCDVYHVPDHFFSLHLDCREHAPADWWWGGVNPLQPADNPENAGKGGFDLRPVEKRIMATVRWTIAHYDIDPNRVYLCGNSMGGSGTLGIGLRHGDVFAAIKANVPAGVLHAADRLAFPPAALPAGMTIPDPPICIDYSAPNDDWSTGHEILFDGMKARKFALFAYWGNFGHANAHMEIKKVNDLIDSFDWLSVRKDEAYPVFTGASSDSPIPWPDRKNADQAGQVNAFFRWKIIKDQPKQFEIMLRLTDADELRSTLFTPPSESTADVSIRRLQSFDTTPGGTVKWSYGEKSGSVSADESGLVTIPSLRVTTEPTKLTLSL